MGAVLRCGRDAALSFGCAAGLWRIHPWDHTELHVTIPSTRTVRQSEIVVHRRRHAQGDLTCYRGIPVTDPAATIVDVAPSLNDKQLMRMINRADKLTVIDPDRLRARVARMGRRRGTAKVTRLLEESTFVLSDSELERIFLPIARSAGLATPRTQAEVNGFKVDFWWPDLGLVVETDGLRYHRTASQQAKDRVRDQVHSAAGLTPLRFTHAQVTYDAGEVERVLRTVAERLARVR